MVRLIARFRRLILNLRYRQQNLRVRLAARRVVGFLYVVPFVMAWIGASHGDRILDRVVLVKARRTVPIVIVSDVNGSRLQPILEDHVNDRDALMIRRAIQDRRHAIFETTNIIVGDRPVTRHTANATSTTYDR